MADRKKEFYNNRGSKSNNFETDTSTENLALAESALIVQKEDYEVTEDMVKDAIVLPNGATSIDFMIPEDEREILEKNLNMYEDAEKMQKLLNIAKKNKLTSEELKSLDLISRVDDFNDKMLELLASPDTVRILEENFRKQLQDEKGDPSKAIKNIGLTTKAMMDAREAMLNKMKAGRGAKATRIALKFQNDSGEEFTLGAEIGGDK